MLCVSRIDYLWLQTSCKMFELEKTQIREFYVLRKLCDLLVVGNLRLLGCFAKNNKTFRSTLLDVNGS